MLLNWKTIEKLEATVSGARNSYKGERYEFDVRLGRSGTPLDLTGEDKERFRIENKELDIAVEADTLQEAKAKLRELLAQSEDYSGSWKLWMKVDVQGGYDGSWRGEDATCTIQVAYVLELTTQRGGDKARKRHVSMTEPLPSPFVGEFPIPTTHKELSKLRDGPVKPVKPDRFDSDDVWVEATPEVVETIRFLQKRLGESGEMVKDALSKKRFAATLEAVRDGSARLLSEGVIPK
jgi:hypothetical protein